MEIGVASARRNEWLDITAEVRKASSAWGKTGMVHLFCPHTTAGLAVNEAFDPDVSSDVQARLGTLVPEDGRYAHREGNSDAHIKSVLAGCQLSLPVRGGKLLLGRWQGIFFCEFDGPRKRVVSLTFIPGEDR